MAKLIYFCCIQMLDFSDHPCNRQCVQGVNFECVYEFNIDNYHTMTKDCGSCPFNAEDCFNSACVAANGHPRGIVTVNKMIPGPAIHVSIDIYDITGMQYE